ncbi:PhoPQ-activated pathogenicity-related family protein [Blastopirellula sp. JC732]|uniref:PhoPQ-activated pathogenicity-related family protein n=1 Tax=Blastopirellula sediminis TaxID=2894196 RepID=A0A9X1MQH2_9BACT|nr:PhoPQ-activated protein PqaA family protein [Blastopirellula sediminis]MCC9606971.1 PhoPQ-activated pathogenicity-related family protein [Blastopirellula sediminis]MCC9629734.1 PhoPQ-activated pathogenicity-related family protein [Blastopirellula sediminis]
MIRLRVVCWFVALTFAFAAPRHLWAESIADPTPTALQDYVAKADDSFTWKLVKTTELPLAMGRLHEVEFTSQTWQGISWTHTLAIFEPKELAHPEHALLFITGGRIGGKLRSGDMIAGARMANAGGVCVGYLLQVPNQPLLGDRVEDDLITESFLRYLDSKDATWPLLFPMAKSAVRAMDVMQAVAKQEWDGKVEKFVVSGASKRGWTTWLTAVADPRVAGIAPIVIDTLNFQPQMKHQIDVWGKYSPQIEDYTSKGLVRVMQEQPEVPLWRWVDPYTYRSQLTLPKLIINGTNDPYWVVDALNIYWDGLSGQKHILYIPNAGHGLEGGVETALTTLVAFVKHVADEKPMPDLQWQYGEADRKITLNVQSDVTPKEVRLWSATSSDGDFRPSKWSATPIQATEGGYMVSVDLPAEGFIAMYAEARYELGGHVYSLTTQIRRQ